jgi:DNA-binding response OmpR family regulator
VTAPACRARVLVIDDEEDIVAYLVAVLQDHGFEALAESDSGAALATAARERPDLMLLDIMMPGESGVSLYRRIRRDRRTAGIPVIIISGYSRQEDVVSLIQREEGETLRRPDGYLEKPITVAEVVERVRALVGTTQGATHHG